MTQYPVSHSAADNRGKTPRLQASRGSATVYGNIYSIPYGVFGAAWEAARRTRNPRIRSGR